MSHVRCSPLGPRLFLPAVMKTTITSATGQPSKFTILQVERRKPSLKCRRPEYCHDLARHASIEAVRSGVEPPRAAVWGTVECAGRLANMLHDHVVPGNDDDKGAVVVDHRSRHAQAAHVHEVLAEKPLHP